MKQVLSRIPKQYRILTLRLCIPLILLTITRIIFFVFNSESFQQVIFLDFLAGIWFDIITVSLVYLPYSILYLLPVPIRSNLWHQRLLRYFFVLITILLVGLNLMDVEYFHYTSKRSTVDLFTILGAGSDLSQLVTTFITDFWYLILFFLLFAFFVVWLYRKTGEFNVNEEFGSKRFYKTNIPGFILFIGLMVLFGRGGFTFRPIGILEASQFTKPANTALVLNTPFTMLKSWGQPILEEQNYYKNLSITENYFNPIQTSVPQGILEDKSNVVIIILESFGNEFIGFYNDDRPSYTPFLDSLLEESLTFQYSFANGKKSIEAVPSIFASIPSLMDNPYISSPYNANKIVGLPELLKGFGYESAFYHGATNGSMRFDAFTSFVGFDHYFGRKEYGNDKHSDKTWGILDEYFEPWTARQISKLKEPFFASMFTLSSHHPYFIPAHMKNKVKRGSQPLCASISYGDISLRKFFEEARKQSWYENTIFVICADHTPATKTKFYNQRTQMYQIPIAFYHPNGKLGAKTEKKIVQQVDIYPTIIDLLNINTSYYSFGKSIYKEGERQSISYLEGVYYYFADNKMMTFSNNEARNLYDFTVKSQKMVDLQKENVDQLKEYEKRLKAIIQRYNHDLIHNQTTVSKK